MCVVVVVVSFTPDIFATVWTPTTAALVLLFLYPICCLKQMRVLVKINSMGFFFMLYVCACVHVCMSHVPGGKVIQSNPILSYPISLCRRRVLLSKPCLTVHLHSYTAIFVCYHGIGVLTGSIPSIPIKAEPVEMSSLAMVGGMVALSFLVHNFIQPIVRFASPEVRVVRDE
jgi:hypothetical protein